MDLFKQFLDNVCVDNYPYKYERVEKLAEIYWHNDVVPIAIVEYNHLIAMNIRFRIGLSSKNIALLTAKIAVSIDSSALVFDEDFIIHEDYGYMYGDEARAVFIERLKSSIEQSQIEEDLQGVSFISQDLLFAYGEEPIGKYQKMWNEE